MLSVLFSSLILASTRSDGMFLRNWENWSLFAASRGLTTRERSAASTVAFLGKEEEKIGSLTFIGQCLYGESGRGPRPLFYFFKLGLKIRTF